jgi:hypothetical protein
MTVAKDFDEWDESKAVVQDGTVDRMSNPFNFPPKKQSDDIGELRKELGAQLDRVEKRLSQLIDLVPGNLLTGKGGALATQQQVAEVRDSIEGAEGLRQFVYGHMKSGNRAVTRGNDESSVRLTRIEMSLSRLDTWLTAITDSVDETNVMVSDISKCIAGNTIATKAQVDRVENKLNQIIGHDESSARLELAMIRDILTWNTDWLEVECGGDVVKGVRVIKAQLDEHEETRKKAIAALADEVKRKPSGRERFMQFMYWLTYDSLIARFFEVLK